MCSSDLGVGLVVLASFYLPTLSGRDAKAPLRDFAATAPAAAVSGPVAVLSVPTETTVIESETAQEDLDDADEITTAEATPATPVQAERVIRVRRGDTFASLLMAVGVPQAEAREALSALKRVFDPKDIKPGQEITLTLGGNREAGEPATLIQAAFAPRVEIGRAHV